MKRNVGEKDERARKVLYVVDDEGSAQFRYRVKNVAEATRGSEWKVEWVMKDELSAIELARVALVVILRQTDKDGVVGEFIEKAHREGVKVVFDLDDLVFDYRDLPVLMWSTGSRNVAYWAGYFWGVRRIARKVDGFICTNDFLAGKLKRSFGKPVGVVPNSLNREQVEVSEKCLKKKKHDGFVIGYFSGSPTHRKDFAMVEGELVKFLREHQDARLLVVGYMKFSDVMREMIKEGRVKVQGVVDYLELQKLMAEVDVNIAPLIVNDFTNCKSELKFFEAGVVETVTVASPNYSFKRAIRDGENGILAEEGEWCDKIEYIYRNVKEAQKMVGRAKKDALKGYYGQEIARKVKRVYEEFTK